MLRVLPMTGKPVSDLDASLIAEFNVNQYEIRLERLASTMCLGSGRRGADHSDSFAIKEFAGDAEKVMVVVDNDAAQGHGPSVHQTRRCCHCS